MKPHRERSRRCRLIEIPRVTDLSGTLSMIEGRPVFPFDPRRFFYIYEVPKGGRRGCHALRTDEELIIALAGSFTILVDDGDSVTEFHLDRPDQRLPRGEGAGQDLVSPQNGRLAQLGNAFS